MGLFNTGAPTAKFLQVGDSCVGRIVDIRQTQRTEFLRGGDIGEPMFWSGGRPIAGAATDPRTGQPNQPVMDHVVTLDCGVEDEEGFTEKRIFVKGKAELASIKAACVAAGVRDVEVGGILKKTWVSGGRPGGADVDNPRVYEYRYKPPTGSDPKPAAGAVATVIEKMHRAHATSPVTAVREAAAAQATSPATPAASDHSPWEDEPPF
jgi:hypothetical protein